MSSLFSQKNYFVRISKRLNPIFFSKKYDVFYSYGKIIGEKYSKDSEFIFFVPDSIINHDKNFIKTKILLNNTSKILITNNYKADTVSSLFNLYPAGYYKLYSPIPFDSESEKPTNKNIFIGINAECLYKFYSLFNPFAQLDKVQLTWFGLFLNKFAFSQPQLFYFFKSGFAGHFNLLWEWPNIYNSNINLLKKYSIDLINTNNTSFNKFVFYLSGLDENNQTKLIKQYQYNKKYNSDLSFNAELKREDLYLSQFIGGLLAKGIHHIYILPYTSEIKQITQHNFYSYAPIKKDAFIHENILASTQNENNFHNRCFLKILNSADINYESALINKLHYNTGLIYLDEKYDFYIKNKISESFVCYLGDSTTFFLTRNHLHSNYSNLNYGENFSKLFESYVENNSYIKYEKIRSKLSPEKIKYLYNSEFLNQFNIYRVENNSLKLTLLQEGSEKKLFIENYGDKIIDEIFNYSTQK